MRWPIYRIGLTGSALAFESDPDWAGPSQHGELIILIDPKVCTLIIRCVGCSFCLIVLRRAILFYTSVMICARLYPATTVTFSTAKRYLNAF